MTSPRRSGSIVTFYSYKGGTGRSMALANVAWLLANSGQRVLVIDWDLEAPGLHRYFEPFLADKTLERSTGVIDFMLDFVTAAVSEKEVGGDAEWYREYSNLLAHAVPLEWQFPEGGSLDFVPAGRQDVAYGLRVNSFDWQNFYERLGGGVLLEAVKENLRSTYDVILIDSRTGVSDTSGVCTVQMPDQLVVCFTLNRQSIYGAAAAAGSAFRQRHTVEGSPTLKVWPVPTRMEFAEKDRLDAIFEIARTRFSRFLHHLGPQREEQYWDEIGVPYEPFYAYEEVLAVFRDQQRRTGSMLAKMLLIATYLYGGSLPARSSDARRRSEVAAIYGVRSARDAIDELSLLGEEYERMRRTMNASDERTTLMTQLLERARFLAADRDADRVAEELFMRQGAGNRIVGLALALKNPQRRHIEIALSAISARESAFEQYHGLTLARQLLDGLESTAATQLAAAIRHEIDVTRTISKQDLTRWTLAQDILKTIARRGSRMAWPRRVSSITADIAGAGHALIECGPSSPTVRYEDPDENHGPFVVTRGSHELHLRETMRIAKYPVTNLEFLQFVSAGGYADDRFWGIEAATRRQFVTRDGTSLGPGSWPNARAVPEGKARNPVSSISYLEAIAFVNWCNARSTDHSWEWQLPMEDDWEYAARSESGLIYPWGDAFDVTRCNSSETNLGDTSDITRFESGASPIGCVDMAGNVWEFVVAEDAGSNWCVMRGGSYKNDRFVLRSYLRLISVPVAHRPPDFGFRLAQVMRTAAG
jgi:formylglycine-generating enzyme required for sulfatase activity